MDEMVQYLIKWIKEDDNAENEGEDLDWEESDEKIVKWFEKIFGR